MNGSSRSAHRFGSAVTESLLNSEQEDRLTDILDQYLTALENGAPLKHEALLAAHPDLADALRAHFRSLDGLHGMAGGFNPNLFSADRARRDGETGRIGDFDLIREIGRGGMGVVYEAQQISLDRRVAVKLLPFAAVLDSKQIARFKTEAQAAAQVQHPNIVPVFAIGVERGVHYYAMQLIEGQPLDQAIAELRQSRLLRRVATPSLAFDRSRTGPDLETFSRRKSPTHASHFSLATAGGKAHFDAVIQLGIQAAEALHAAHEYGVVHRDIKPSNLLLEAGGKLWITDFGLARYRHDVTLTRTGDVVGTMRYMSPEQAAGRPALIDHRTDIYSLGATLYELLCLQPAFPEDNSPALISQIDRAEPVPPRKIQPQIPADLESIVLKALAKEREDRYATAQELADDLRRHVDGKPTLAKPPTIVDRSVKWLRRHQRAVAIGSAALLFLVVGLATANILITQQKFVAQRNLARSERLFHDAREVLDKFGLQLAERLKSIDGADDVREELLRETRQYYQHFIDEARNDPALRADMALTFGKIATVLDDGAIGEAIAAHEKSLSLFAELAAAQPRNVEHQQRLAQSKNNLALLLGRAGQVQRAQLLFNDAIQSLEQLLHERPADAALMADLALAYSNSGLLQSSLGSKAEAKASLGSAVNLLEKIAKERPSDPQHQQRLATAYNNLASTELDAQPQRAIALHQRALELQLAAAEAASENRDLRRDVSLTLNNLGAASSRLNLVDEAANYYERATGIQQELVQQAPSNRTYQADLAISQNNLGLIHTRLRRFTEAETAFRNCLQAQEQLLAHSTDDANLLSSAGGAYNNLGIVLEQTDRDSAAAEAFEKAIEHQRAAWRQSPGTARYRDFLLRHYVNYSRVLRRLGHLDDEIEIAKSRRELSAGDGAQLFAVAEQLASIYEALDPNGTHRNVKAACGQLAVETLKQSTACGFVPPEHFERREPFAALGDLPQFAVVMGINQ